MPSGRTHRRPAGPTALTVATVAVALLAQAACTSSAARRTPDAGAGHGAGAGSTANGQPWVVPTERTMSAHRHHLELRRPLAGKTIGVDPGHNGGNYADPSYIDRQIWNGREYENCNTTGTSTDAGYSEATFTWRVAEDLRHDLLEAGAHVVMTRHNNHGVGPCVNERAHIINHAHANVGIDIHGDGGPPGGRGFAILEPVRDKENRRVLHRSAEFGSILRQAVLRDTPMPTSTYDGVNGITHRNNLAGLNLTRVPLVLIECGNMRNSTDATLMTSGHFQQGLARAFTKAIKKFVLRNRH
jgi:N-acetylmuramoyl-L-alanine amidase